MKDNLKRLIAEMDVKKEFVIEVANYYHLTYEHVSRRMFQGDWDISEERLPKILDMAQKWLYAQNKRKEQVLKKTGFKKQ